MTRKRIAIDMDDVMADTVARKVEWYERDFGIKVDRAALKGLYFHDTLPEEHQVITRKYAYQKGFFKDLPVNENCVEVVKALCEKYEVFIVTAAMPFPYSFNEKYDWLLEHFPFIDCRYFVFCGHKYMIQADFLIDDSAVNLVPFTGKSLIYTSEHNFYDDRFTRVNNWLEVKAMLLDEDIID